MAELIRPIIRDCFVIGLCTFAFYFFADFVKPGLVTNYVNLNALLLFVILFGIVTVLLSDDRYAEVEPPVGGSTSTNGYDTGSEH